MKTRTNILLLLGWWALFTEWVNRFADAAPQRWHPELVDEWSLGGGSGDNTNTPVDILAAHDIIEKGKPHGFVQGPTTDRSTNNNKQQQDDVNILHAPSTASKISLQLQQQEEQDLERLDQLILDTLQHAIDTTEQNQPIRWISIEEATTHLLESHSRWTILFSYWASWTSSLILWFCMMVVATIIYLVVQRKKHLSSRDCHPHHLPSFTVCKQRRTVD